MSLYVLMFCYPMESSKEEIEMLATKLQELEPDFLVKVQEIPLELMEKVSKEGMYNSFNRNNNVRR